MSEPTDDTAGCSVCGTTVLAYEIYKPPLPPNLVLAQVKFTPYGPALLVLDPCEHRLDN